MNLSALQIIRPIPNDASWFGVIAGRFGRLALVYAIIAFAGAVLASLGTILTWRGLALSTLGLSIALVVEFVLVVLLMPQLPRFARSWGSCATFDLSAAAASGHISKPLRGWQTSLRRAVLETLLPILINVLAMVAGWRIGTPGRFFWWGILVGLCIGSVLLAITLVFRVIAYRRIRHILARIEAEASEPFDRS